KLKGSWVLVRTSGRYPGARGGNDGRSWLLIKHRDDWSGDLDITTFAPRSVKSDGDFADILGEDMPAVWRSNRPAKGGDTGAMFARIIEQAEKLKTPKSGNEEGPQRKSAEKRSHEATKTRRTSKASKSSGVSKASKAKSKTAL